MVHLLCIGALSITVLMLLAWTIYLFTRNPSVIDLFWALGFVVLLCIYHYFGSYTHSYNLIVFAIGLLWAVRLFFFLFLTRSLAGFFDPRYEELSSTWKIKKSFGFLANYFLQGFLLLLVSLPFLVLSLSHLKLDVFFVLGSVVALFAIVNEALADWQLARFKSSLKKEEKQVCQSGWWRLSRHPNYFFEWLTWLGFAIVAFPHQYGMLALVSPAIMLFIFLGITIDITERHSILSKGHLYEKYQSTTHKFFPWKPK